MSRSHAKKDIDKPEAWTPERRKKLAIERRKQSANTEQISRAERLLREREWDEWTLQGFASNGSDVTAEMAKVQRQIRDLRTYLQFNRDKEWLGSYVERVCKERGIPNPARASNSLKMEARNACKRATKLIEQDHPEAIEAESFLGMCPRCGYPFI